MATVGIDLGTSNSAAAVLRGGRPVIIPSAEGISLGGKAFPSYVAITADGQTLICEPARRQAAANPAGTATGFKRKMGTREKLRLHDREFTPEQLSSLQRHPGHTGTSRPKLPPPRVKPGLQAQARAAGWSMRIMKKAASH